MAVPRQRPRTCVACREESPKKALIRVVRSPSGEVVLDERGKLPGRGAYLCACLECVEKARKSKALSRALKTEVGADIYDRLAKYVSTPGTSLDEPQMRKELRMLLGLSKRAGLVYIGIDSVKSQSVKEILLILTAAERSGGVMKETVKLTEAGHVHIESTLDINSLSSALGAEGVQVIALPDRSGLADKIKMLLNGKSRSLLTEGRAALEQNESV